MTWSLQVSSTPSVRACSRVRDLAGREVVARHHLSASRPAPQGPTPETEGATRLVLPGGHRGARRRSSYPRTRQCVQKAGVAEIRGLAER